MSKKVGRPSTSVEVPCAGCGTTITRRPSEVKASATGRFFCSPTCRNKVGSKPRMGVTKTCEHCGAEYYRRQAMADNSRFCSRDCKDQAAVTNGTEERTCKGCGNTFEFNLRMAKWNAGVYCTRDCMNHHRRESAVGQTKPTSDGYVMEYQPDSPMAQPSTGYVLQHRLVMSEALGRPLTPSENPHHVNGDRTDNRIENLELWNTSQPAGQRVEDKIAWATQLLDLYGYDVAERHITVRKRLRKAGAPVK